MVSTLQSYVNDCIVPLIKNETEIEKSYIFEKFLGLKWRILCDTNALKNLRSLIIPVFMSYIGNEMFGCTCEWIRQEEFRKKAKNQERLENHIKKYTVLLKYS